MLHKSQLFLIKFVYIIILLAYYSETTYAPGRNFDSNIGSNFPIQAFEVSSSSTIKSYPSFSSPNLQSSVVDSDFSNAKKINASNSEATKSNLKPTVTISAPNNGVQPLPANIFSGSSYTYSRISPTFQRARLLSEVQSSTAEDSSPTSTNACSKLPLSRNLNVIPPASMPPFLPNKESKSSFELNTYRGTNLNSFAQAALSSPALQEYWTYKISGLDAAVIFFNHAYNTLRYLGAPNYASNANEISKAVASINILTLPRYFQATGNAITKFLLLKGINISPNFPQEFARIIENSVLSSNIDGSVTLYQALLNGFSKFISSLGFCDGKEADNLSFIFSSELMSL